ncbi:MAG: hypothetical protein JW917_08160 [Ignavibacteria bacterium]|nr:hypothetical protein [Ignavibacteria bacterium]
MKKKRRTDYLLNKTKILEALKKLIQEKGRKPTISEIAAESGVYKRTVERHLQNYRNEDYAREFRILTDEVLIALYKKAIEGKAPEVKLWMQLVEKWRETQGIDHSGKVKFEKINFVLAEKNKFHSESQNN